MTEVRANIRINEVVLIEVDEHDTMDQIRNKAYRTVVDLLEKRKIPMSVIRYEPPDDDKYKADRYPKHFTMLRSDEL